MLHAGSTVPHKLLDSRVTQTQVLNLKERKCIDIKNKIIMQFRTCGHTGVRGTSGQNLCYNLEEHEFIRQASRERKMVQVPEVKHDLLCTTEAPWESASSSVKEEANIPDPVRLMRD